MSDIENIITEYRDKFCAIPNLIYEMELSAYEIALYSAIKRSAGDSGHCTRSSPTLAKNAGMSEGKVSQAKQDLVSRGLIAIDEIPSRRGRPRHKIRINPLIWIANDVYFLLDPEDRPHGKLIISWDEQIARTSPVKLITSPGEVISSQGEIKSSRDEVISSPGEMRKNLSSKNQLRKNRGEEVPAAAAANTPAPDHVSIDWKNEDQPHETRTSVLDDPRAQDPIGLGAACAERQAESRANGLDPGYTVPADAGGGDPRADAMVEAWIDAQDLDPEQVPERLLRQYRRAMITAAEGLSASPEQAAQAVRYALTHPDYSWCNYGHPKNAKFQRDVAGIMLQLLSGVDLPAQRRETQRPVDEDKGLAMILRLEREEAENERGASRGD
jgi:hypothetical protein